MTENKHRYWSDQLKAIGKELSILAVACDIDFFDESVPVKILKNDDSVCGRKNPEAFRKLRAHLMALFPLETAALDRIGVEDTGEILDDVRAMIATLRSSGGASGKPS